MVPARVPHAPSLRMGRIRFNQQRQNHTLNLFLHTQLDVTSAFTFWRCFTGMR
jgi:hypothetical protein